MALLCRIPVVWDGLPGLPGLSVFYSTPTDVVTTVVALKAFFTSAASMFPTALTWQFPSDGDEIDDSDGELQAGWNGGAGGTVTGSGGAGTYAAGCGFRVTWGTNTIVDGRRLKGSTFMVPILSTAYDTSGTIQNASVATMLTAANTLVTNGTTVIWHRPDKGAANGSSATVLSAAVPDKVATLRSRRV